MSVSNKTYEDSSLDLSHKFRGEEADYHISNKIKSLSNPLDLNDSTDTTDSETNECIHNRDSRREKNEEKDYRNQMIDLPKLIRQLSLARVVLKRLPVSTEATKLQTTHVLAPVDVGIVDQDVDANAPQDEDVRPSEYIDNDGESHADSAIGDTCDFVDNAEKKFAAKSTTSCNRQKHANLIKRYCPKCKKPVEDAFACKKQLCTKCKTPMTYQCVRCENQFSSYQSVTCHFDRKCNTQNLDLKCSECDYRTHAKTLMTKHLTLCLSGIHFSCGLCKYTTRLRQNLFRHIFSMHKDIFKVDCSQCKTKQNKCKQCKNMVPFCEACHTGFSSTDRFEEHQKSCKQPVLECKYCPFKTDVNNELKKHIRFEHLSGSISQAMPTQE